MKEERDRKIDTGKCDEIGRERHRRVDSDKCDRDGGRGYRKLDRNKCEVRKETEKNIYMDKSDKEVERRDIEKQIGTNVIKKEAGET